MELVDAKARLCSHLIEQGFEASRAHALADLLRPCIRFETLPSTDDEIPVGASKVGGAPDLPAGTVWPMREDVPMTFLAQFNLAELIVHGLEGDLPVDGLLSLFYEVAAEAFGYEAGDLGAWRVLWSPADDLARRPIPLGLPAEAGDLPTPTGFRPCRVRLHPSFSAPVWDAPQLEAFELTDEEDDAFFKAWTENERSCPDAHQILGYAIPIQSAMEEICQEGLMPPQLGNRNHEERERMIKEAAFESEWRLLCQLSHDENSGMEWGDAGMLYFWIRGGDLRSLSLQSVWMVSQCH